MAGDSTGIEIPAVMIGQADGQLLIDTLEDEDETVSAGEASTFDEVLKLYTNFGSVTPPGSVLNDPDFKPPLHECIRKRDYKKLTTLIEKKNNNIVSCSCWSSRKEI